MSEWMNEVPIRQSSEALAAEEMTFESLYKCLDGHSWSPQFDGEARMVNLGMVELYTFLWRL